MKKIEIKYIEIDFPETVERQALLNISDKDYKDFYEIPLGDMLKEITQEEYTSNQNARNQEKVNVKGGWGYFHYKLKNKLLGFEEWMEQEYGEVLEKRRSEYDQYLNNFQKENPEQNV